MALVDHDQVEEILRESREPSISPTRELLDIGNDDVRILAVMYIRIPTVQDSHVRAMAYVGQHSRRGPEAISTGNVKPESSLQLKTLPLTLWFYGYF